MDTDITKLKNNQSLKNKWDILYKSHNAIISFDKKIRFRIFPIYIQYTKGEDVIAILYYRGKHVNIDNINIGLNLKQKPNFKEVKDGLYLKYASINYSLLFKNQSDINILIKLLNLT